MTPKEILQARGIYDVSLKLGWTEGANYWEFPLFDLDGNEIARRGKAYPNQNLPKYIWLDGKPKNPASDYYIPKGTIEAIRDAGGICYLANGETALVAFHAAGIYNVIATPFSEVTVPKTLIETLEKLGVTLLINIADKDKAGTAAAAKWRDSLRDSEYGYQAKQWPDYLAEKSDFNDLFIHHAFDISKTVEALHSCQALILPQPEVKAPKVITEKDKTPQGLIDLIASHFGIQQWDSEGFSRKNVFCPFHDDKTKESAGFNQISGVLNCFACGAHSPKAVAEQLGIRWQDYYPKREKKKKAKTGDRRDLTAQDVQSALNVDSRRIRQASIHVDRHVHINTAWINQPELPISWIKGFLHLTHSKSITVLLAIELHRAIYKGLIDGQDFTMKDILSIFDHPRKSTALSVEFLTSLNYVSILYTNLLEEDLKTKSTQKDSVTKKQGRPETHYRINTDTPSLAIALAERLEPVLLERLTDDLELAPRNHLLRDALDLELVEFKVWHERTNTAKHDYITDFISGRICDVLENTSYIEFEAKDLEHPSCLRGKLIKLILEPYSEAIITLTDGTKMLRERIGLQLSRAKLAWELGCSESALSNLYQEYNIGTKEIYAWHEVLRPNDCDIEKEIREAPYNINKEVGGVAYGGVLHYWDGGILKKTKLLARTDLITEFRRHNFRIEKLYLQVQQPSLLWNMTEQEIADKRAKEATIAGQELESADSPEERHHALAKLEKAQGKATPKKKTTVSGKDRLYTGLSPEFVFKELEKEVKETTPYTFKGLSVIDESTGEIIHIVKALKEVVIWLNHYQPEPIAPKVVAPKLLPPVAPKPAIKQEVIEKPVYDTSKDIADLVRIFSGG